MEIRITPFEEIEEEDEPELWRELRSRKSRYTNMIVKQEHMIKKKKESKEKIYKIVDSEVKTQILVAIKKGILLLIDWEKEVLPLSTSRFLQLIDVISPIEYNQLLLRVLHKYVGITITEPKKQSQWKTKIKNWMLKSLQPEKRGGVVVPDEYFDDFKQKVIQILKQMTIRVFPSFREQLVTILEEYHDRNPRNYGKVFNRNTCSKHWWFDFLKKHTDIKLIWEKLPLGRYGSVTKLQRLMSPENDDTMEEEEPEEQDQSPVDLPFESHMSASTIESEEISPSNLKEEWNSEQKSESFPRVACWQ